MATAMRPCSRAMFLKQSGNGTRKIMCGVKTLRTSRAVSYNVRRMLCTLYSNELKMHCSRRLPHRTSLTISQQDDSITAFVQGEENNTSTQHNGGICGAISVNFAQNKRTTLYSLAIILHEQAPTNDWPDLGGSERTKKRPGVRCSALTGTITTVSDSLGQR